MNVVSSQWSVVSKKIFSFALCAMLFALCFAADAQQVKKIPRIGMVVSSEANSSAFREGLRDLGYIEGENLRIEYRHSEGKLDRIPGLVSELLERKVDLLFFENQVAFRAAKRMTKTIPIVMVSSVDPVTAGHVDSLSHPGGNITGLSQFSRDLSAKRVELLRETIPKMRRLAILWDPEGPGPRVAFKEYEAAARTLNLRFQPLELRAPKPNIENAFVAANSERADALILVANPLTGFHRQTIVELATRDRLPLMGEGGGLVEVGGLISYGAHAADLFRRAALYADKILKGAKPADLPVEQPTKFELVINLKTAKQIGITIPPNILARADRVIR